VNRHERRRLIALGERLRETGELPEHYVKVIDAIAHTYRAGLKRYPPGEELPRFRFGPREIMVIGSLAYQIDRIAVNRGARIFLEGVVSGALRSGDSKNMPTVFMTEAALSLAGATIERVSAAEFGLTVGGANN